MGDRTERGTAATLLALVAAAAVAGGAASAASVTGSLSALALGALSAAVAGSQALLLLSGRRAGALDEGEQPFGAGSERHYWAFVLSVALFGAAAMVGVLAGSVQRSDPEPLTDGMWAQAAAGGGLVAALVVLRVGARVADRVRRRATWRRFIRSAESPQLPLLLTQAVALSVGAATTLAATATTEHADQPAADGWAAIAVGGLAAIVALGLVGQLKTLLIGESPDRRDVEAISAAVTIDPAVRRLLSLSAQRRGPDALLIAAKVELDHTLTLPEASEVVHRIERNVRASVPAARTMVIEADVPDEHRAAPPVDEHEPGHEVTPEIRAAMEAEARRGGLGEHIPVEPDL